MDGVAFQMLMPGATLHPLPDDETADRAFVLLRVIDEDGDVSWSSRTT